MRTALIEAIKKSFKDLVDNDGNLFDCPNENEHYHARKLHEVCINHRLAVYFEKHILLPIIDPQNDSLYVADRTGIRLYASIIAPQNGSLYVDIEFNREGKDPKQLEITNKKITVRPDIIIHNRQSGTAKNNFLIVECKKDGTTKRGIEQDQIKIKAFLKDDKYQYRFGLQVIYSASEISGVLYDREGGTPHEIVIPARRDN